MSQITNSTGVKLKKANLWFHLASWNLPDFLLFLESKTEPNVINFLGFAFIIIINSPNKPQHNLNCCWVCYDFTLKTRLTTLGSKPTNFFAIVAVSKLSLSDMRIVAGMAGPPGEPSSHKVRNQNRQVLRVVVTTLNQYKRKVTI